MYIHIICIYIIYIILQYNNVTQQLCVFHAPGVETMILRRQRCIHGIVPQQATPEAPGNRLPGEGLGSEGGDADLRFFSMVGMLVPLSSVGSVAYITPQVRQGI